MTDHVGDHDRPALVDVDGPAERDAAITRRLRGGLRQSEHEVEPTALDRLAELEKRKRGRKP